VLWAHVTLAPEASKTIVFNIGTVYGLIIETPRGGQQEPESTPGDSPLWKYAQKKAKKKQISEVINRITPRRMPLVTCLV
jgi:hypothetical protein